MRFVQLIDIKDLIHGANFGQPIAKTASVTAVYETSSTDQIRFSRIIHNNTSEYKINDKVHFTDWSIAALICSFADTERENRRVCQSTGAAQYSDEGEKLPRLPGHRGEHRHEECEGTLPDVRGDQQVRLSIGEANLTVVRADRSSSRPNTSGRRKRCASSRRRPH